jgi:hypothetical protein
VSILSYTIDIYHLYDSCKPFIIVMIQVREDDGSLDSKVGLAAECIGLLSAV